MAAALGVAGAVLGVYFLGWLLHIADIYENEIKDDDQSSSSPRNP